MQGTSRPTFLLITALTTLAWTLSAAALTLFAGKPWAAPAFYPIMTALGLSFGASWTLMATIVSEIFGLRYFSTNYALVQLGSMASSFVFPSYIVAQLYDAAAAEQNPGGDPHSDLMCLGTSCFFSAFLVMAALALVVRAFCSLSLFPVPVATPTTVVVTVVLAHAKDHFRHAKRKHDFFM